MITNAAIIFAARDIDHRILNNSLDNISLLEIFGNTSVNKKKLWGGSCYVPKTDPPKKRRLRFTTFIFGEIALIYSLFFSFIRNGISLTSFTSGTFYFLINNDYSYHD